MSAHRSKGVLRGEVAWVNDLEGEGVWTPLSRLTPGNEKAHGYKQWIAIGLSLLRFL
jgi:hypothetical protein